MSSYPEPERHITDKLKQYQTQQIMLLKRIRNDTGIDASDLAAKKDVIAVKAKVGKVDIDKLVNVPTSFNTF